MHSPTGRLFRSRHERDITGLRSQERQQSDSQSTIGIALWRVPSTAAAAVASFLPGVTPTIRDCWNVDDAEQHRQQLIHFPKNTALFGAALAFLKIGQRED